MGMERLDRLNKVKRRRGAVNLRPRDAASLIVVDSAGGTPRILFGRRHPRQKFVPDKYVFPGGRVEQCDTRLRIAADLADGERALLMHAMKGRASAARARALALAALRETFEETGILIGSSGGDLPETRAPAWQAFLAHGAVPRLEGLAFVARAVTPPRRPRRYDTRFFVVSAEHILKTVGEGDGEFTETQWLTFDEAKLYDLHAMTRTILDDVAEYLGLDSRQRRRRPVPYYYSRQGVFVRELIERPGCGTPGA